MMQRYANKSGKSGIRFFQTGKDFIVVEFINGDRYLYNYKMPGRKEVEEMKKLASDGIGLATYISQNINSRYALKNMGN